MNNQFKSSKLQDKVKSLTNHSNWSCHLLFVSIFSQYISGIFFGLSLNFKVFSKIKMNLVFTRLTKMDYFGRNYFHHCVLLNNSKYQTALRSNTFIQFLVFWWKNVTFSSNSQKNVSYTPKTLILSECTRVKSES